jgi:hypothetical protein
VASSSLGGECRLIHVHFSKNDLGVAKTFADLFYLLDTVDFALSLTSLAGGDGPGVGEIVSTLQYVIQRFPGNQQLKITATYGFYDITIMQVAGQSGKYYETSLVGLQALAYQDLVSKLISLGLTVAAIITAVAVSVLSGGTGTPVSLWIIFAVTAAQTWWYVNSFLYQIPSSFFLNGNVPAYSVVTFQKLYTLTMKVVDSKTGKPVVSASIYVDDVLIGKSDSKGQLVLNIRGVHTVKVVAMGYNQYQASVNVMANTSYTIKLS